MSRYTMIESMRRAYSDWLASVDSVPAVEACIAHARKNGATDEDIDDITHHAHFITLARTYGDGGC